MIVRVARSMDLAGFLGLAGQVEQWFGPMVDDPGFRRAVEDHIGRGAALVVDAPVDAPAGDRLLGGLLFGSEPPLHHVHWLVVSEEARGLGVGRALMAEALSRFAAGGGTVEVVTFGADHPGAVAGGARVFYESLGFTPGEPAPAGPEGGSRQVYRRAVG
ncbi:GNAT family N-acetyltransferase [Kitasatospora sp. NBC_00240]|uniref:GNAT family N-acetyltransferase n=1 Tax=Kitasatospora sp. NBC_00240 TaxID=2903567 RepID=UPI00224D868D|nr:GNAT family N-acetyltransferase [Kitasatospora sp. NBC_00240]MCX5211625.1 GNAT family N-acetyltransferase [Kitasatospora sp. NBC_00240]